MTQSENDRGAALIHVAAALLALMAFSTFIMDYGVYWSARRQAQNSADAAALAGAVALGYDSPTDFSDTSAAKESALAEVQRNLVWGQAPSALASDVTFPTSPSVCTDSTGTSHFCVRVDVYRTAARSNALPMFFGKFVSLTSQDVQATAIAIAAGGNASNCMRPWAVVDKFVDSNGDGLYGAGDNYQAPSASGPGTGYSVAVDYGTEVNLKIGSNHDSLSPGWFMGLDFGSGANTYNDAITGCVGREFGIGDTVTAENGDMSGPTTHGVNDLIAEDSNAMWDPTANNGRGAVINSCAPGSCGQYSPRIVPVPVFDPSLYPGQIKITNIFGFFVERVTGNGNNNYVQGRLINVPAVYDSSKGTVSAASSFLKFIQLVR